MNERFYTSIKKVISAISASFLNFGGRKRAHTCVCVCMYIYIYIYIYVCVCEHLIPFLDVLTDSTNNTFTTSPYKKPTKNNSTLLNYHRECLQKYKIVIIKKLIHRAFYISSSKTIFYNELIIKQTLVNYDFPYKLVDQQIKLPSQHSQK